MRYLEVCTRKKRGFVDAEKRSSRPGRRRGEGGGRGGRQVGEGASSSNKYAPPGTSTIMFTYLGIYLLAAFPAAAFDFESRAKTRNQALLTKLL